MGYDFETDKNYNYERFVSMIIELKKTCFSKGEIISGNIILSPKTGLTESQLINPYVMMTLEEKHYYQYLETNYDPDKKRTSYENKEEQQIRTLFTIRMDFSNFNGANILTGVQIPFQIKVPETAYPSCFFDSISYVKHFLICDFPSIGAKKTVVIVIKNNLFFSIYNGLLKSPVLCYKEETKYKYILFNYGSFSATVQIPKNIFEYNENIPFIIDIDCTKLSLTIKSIRVCIKRNERKNYLRDFRQKRSEKETEIVSKTIPLIKDEKKYHIEDIIRLPNSSADLNPREVYQILDNDKRKYKEKFNNIKLFPSCYNGLLTCEYYLKIILEMDTWFSSNEEFKIPIDLYEPFNNNNNEIFLTEQNCINNTNLNYNNNTQTPNCYYQSNLQQIPPPMPQVNNFNSNFNKPNEDELPSEEDIKNYQKNNNIDKDEEDKDGSAPPPGFVP